MDKREEIKKNILAKKQTIQSDNPAVEINRQNLEAVTKLADGNNDIFSQLEKNTFQDETFDYAKAMSFAVSPLKQMEERLARRGIQEKVFIPLEENDVEMEIETSRPIRIKVNSLIEFLKEFLVRRHCLNRNRVEEYINALDKANGKDTLLQQTEQAKKGMFNRLG